ncbi:MAG: threonine ammonia-lyase [Methanosarcinales archaeon]|nr:threonine ammonia-lyase [Methanosarcinales archaeon]
MISLAEFQDAARVLQGRILPTPLIYSPTFSQMSGAEVYLKLECLQKGGSFKVRGATYKVQSRRQEIGPGGVVAASAGNHAQGVALAARDAGVPARIVMPRWVSISKQEATRRYGAEVILQGETLVESIALAREMAGEGRTFIHPYDDREIVTGQGTIGLEIVEDLPDVDCIFVPLGGGGLISGIALAARALRPEVRMVGVQAASCPSARAALQAGEPVEVAAQKSIADAITVTRVGDLNFPIIRDCVDHVALVEEDQIAAAILMLLERKKVLAEGAGAAPLAALLNMTASVARGSKVVLVVSGGNLDRTLLDRILRQGMLHSGRIMRFSVCLEDVPGSLARLLSLMAEQEANVLHIRHVRSERELPICASRVEVEMETRGFEHVKRIAEALRQAGYRMEMK